MESAWPPTARFRGGGVCRLLYWNPGWLTWASIICSGWNMNNSGVSLWFANWKLVYIYIYIYIYMFKKTHIHIYIYILHILRKFHHWEAGSKFEKFLASLPDVFGRFRTVHRWTAGTVAAGGGSTSILGMGEHFKRWVYPVYSLILRNGSKKHMFSFENKLSCAPSTTCLVEKRYVFMSGGWLWLCTKLHAFTRHVRSVKERLHRTGFLASKIVLLLWVFLFPGNPKRCFNKSEKYMGVFPKIGDFPKNGMVKQIPLFCGDFPNPMFFQLIFQLLAGPEIWPPP